MPPKKNKPKITPGQLRGIIREMNQPPFNAVRRKVPRNKPTPKRASGKVKRTETGIKKTPATIAQERYQAYQMRLQRMEQKLRRPTTRQVSPLTRPKVQKRQESGLRPGGKRRVGIDLQQLPRLVKTGIISQQEADIIRNAAEGRRVNYRQAGVSVRDTSNILKRELNLTLSARERLDAEEARLAREEQLSRNKQWKESQRNPRIQNPLKEPITRRVVEEQVRTGLREIAKAEKEKKKRQRKPLRPKTIVPRGTGRGGMGGGIPLTGIGGGGLMKLD